jgi:hypothetical protein
MELNISSISMWRAQGMGDKLAQSHRMLCYMWFIYIYLPYAIDFMAYRWRLLSIFGSTSNWSCWTELLHRRCWSHAGPMLVRVPWCAMGCVEGFRWWHP